MPLTVWAVGTCEGELWVGCVWASGVCDPPQTHCCISTTADGQCPWSIHHIPDRLCVLCTGEIPSGAGFQPHQVLSKVLSLGVFGIRCTWGGKPAVPLPELPGTLEANPENFQL